MAGRPRTRILIEPPSPPQQSAQELAAPEERHLVIYGPPSNTAPKYFDRECTEIRCREGDARLHLMTDDCHCSDGADCRDPKPAVEPNHGKDRGSKVTSPNPGSRFANIIIKGCTCRCRQSSGRTSRGPLKSQDSDGIGCLNAQGTLAVGSRHTKKQSCACIFFDSQPPIFAQKLTSSLHGGGQRAVAPG